MSGAPIDQPTTVITAAGHPTSVRVRHLRFDVVEGPDRGAAAVLSGRELLAGSHPSNDLVLADRAVSRFHFHVHAGDRGYRLLDPASTNGTYVDGLRVHDAYLSDGARIQVGGSTIVVRFEDTESEIELSAEQRFGDAVGSSVVMRELFAAARKVAATDATVLLWGETGTGKELLARAIAAHSPRAEGPYVVLDCGATPPTLIESILFGHARGAFTGAETSHAGVFERASGGTLFIDEIGELPLGLQPKLLRALESATVTPLGATSPISIDVRVVAATNRDLRAMVEQDAFRADLYYRLAVFPLRVPALRERPEDVPLLAGCFARQLLYGDRDDPGWLPAHLREAFGQLAEYPWPGNARELRNLVERAVALAGPDAFTGKGALAQLSALRKSVTETMTKPKKLSEVRAESDRAYLSRLVAGTQGDLGRAAEIAGIHRKSLERLLRRYGVRRP